MNKTHVRIALGCCLLAAAVLSWAQAVRKPGLWEMTSTTTWQKSPMPPGMTLPPGAANPFAPTTRTTEVCLTREMIDKFGVPVTTPAQSCTISNVVLKSDSMTAEMTCTGKMNMHATMESSWPSGNTAHGKIHVTGTMQMGPNASQVEYTVESTSTYKGADCGSVKPLPMPATK
ncbi:MAG: DUF3617 family protein [Terracidiphilus sp.]|jgi:hypothetical protein